MKYFCIRCEKITDAQLVPVSEHVPVVMGDNTYSCKSTTECTVCGKISVEYELFNC